MRSICHQSATLTEVFKETLAAEQRSLASCKDFGFQEATPATLASLAWASGARGAIPAIRISSEPAHSPSSSPGVVDAAPAGARPPAEDLMVDVNDKRDEAMDMTAKLINRRRIEATRRQVRPPLLHTLGPSRQRAPFLEHCQAGEGHAALPKATRAHTNHALAHSHPCLRSMEDSLGRTRSEEKGLWSRRSDVYGACCPSRPALASSPRSGRTTRARRAQPRCA